MPFSSVRRQAEVAAAGWVQRMQPGLGTFISLRVRGLETASAHAAMTSAFAVARAYEAGMSRQTPGSDLDRLGQAAAGAVVTVTPATHEVLRLALGIAQDSDGVFDPVMPGHDADWRSVALLPDCGVRLARRLKLSLDGIAKGHAADAMCAVLKAAGATDVVVDAGGDLAVDSVTAQSVGLRNPRDLGTSLRDITVARGGVATSAGYGGISQLWHRGRWLETWPCAVTVVAPSCAVADALTKVAAVDRDAHRLFATWGAQVMVY